MQPLEGGEPPSPPSPWVQVAGQGPARRSEELLHCGGEERGDLPAPHPGSSVLVCSVKQEDAEPCLGSGGWGGGCEYSFSPSLAF